MAQKYYNVAEAAKVLGISDADVKQLLDRRDLHGYRDGADWKFKSEDIDRMAAEGVPNLSGDDEAGDVLLSEVALGHSDPALSGTVIGSEKGKARGGESDIRLAAQSDVKLAESAIGLAESGIELGAERRTPPGRKDEMKSKVSQFEELDMTLDQDLTLEDSALAPSSPVDTKGGSALDIGNKLEDDDLVLGGSGTGSDITIGGDSGISLVDPADSGLSLEAPLNLGSSTEESLELGEDDLLSFSTDTESSGLKSEDDFQLTPMEDLTDGDDSESGSQVIALDTEGEGDEAATMVASGSSVAAMLDDDLGGTESALGLAGAPLMAMGDVSLVGPGDPMGMGGQYMGSAMALPEAPYSIWNILGLVVCSLMLILVGWMMFDIMRNMWSWESASPASSWLMDTVLSWFEK